MSTPLDDSADYLALMAKVDPFILRGDYKPALTLVRIELQKRPHDFDLRYQYAKLLGDWADELPPAQQKKYKAEAVAILSPLMKKLRGKPLETRFRLSLNFYYQSADWEGMYAFGERFMRRDRHRALYAKSLGATLLAFDLSVANALAKNRESKRKAAHDWARRATKLWGLYDFSKEASYFPFYCYAKALALDGQVTSAMKQLKIAARLGKRSVTDWEFADVAKLCALNF
jgi:hypothetical protein